MGARQVWFKLSHRDWRSICEVLSFWLTNHEYEEKIVMCKTVYGKIAASPSISIISIILGIWYKGPWGIGRLSEVNNGIWPQIRMVFCRIKDIVIFWKKIVSRCQSARRLSAPDFHPRTLHYWLLHLLCTVRRMYLWNRPFNGNKRHKTAERRLLSEASGGEQKWHTIIMVLIEQSFHSSHRKPCWYKS